MVQFLDIIRFVENVKKDIYIYICGSWIVRSFVRTPAAFYLHDTSNACHFHVLQSFSTLPPLDRRIASLFRILAISAINGTCTFRAIFSLFEGSLIIRDILIWFIDNKWKLMEKNLVFVFFWFFVTLAEKSILIIVISQFRCDSSVKKFLNSG